jgi:hypothetical protein
MWVHEDIAPSLEGLSYAAFTRGLGWSKEETEVFLAGVRKDINNTKLHAYWEMCESPLKMSHQLTKGRVVMPYLDKNPSALKYSLPSHFFRSGANNKVISLGS